MAKIIPNPNVFNTKLPYFTEKQEKRIRDFVSGDGAPVVEHTFTNTKDESRRVNRVFYPKGTITKETIFEKMKDGSKNYMTPSAGITGVLGRVIYTEDDKAEVCSSEEWLRWFGGGKKEHTPTPEPPKINIEAVVAMHTRTKNEEKSDLEASWKPMKGNIKTKKKP